MVRKGLVRGRHGGVEKEGGGRPHEGHPSQKRFWTPLHMVRFFSTPRRFRCLFFLYRNQGLSTPEALLEGSENFLEGALSGTFPPAYVVHRPISWPNLGLEPPSCLLLERSLLPVVSPDGPSRLLKLESGYVPLRTLAACCTKTCYLSYPILRRNPK